MNVLLQNFETFNFHVLEANLHLNQGSYFLMSGDLMEVIFPDYDTEKRTSTVDHGITYFESIKSVDVSMHFVFCAFWGCDK